MSLFSLFYASPSLPYTRAKERAARKLNLAGFVENTIQSRTTYASSRKAKPVHGIDQFIEQVHLTKPPIRVEELEVRFEPATGEFAYFAITRGDMAEELGERLDIANAKMNGMIQKQNVMIETLDHNTALLKE